MRIFTVLHTLFFFGTYQEKYRDLCPPVNTTPDFSKIVPFCQVIHLQLSPHFLGLPVHVLKYILPPLMVKELHKKRVGNCR